MFVLIVIIAMNHACMGEIWLGGLWCWIPGKMLLPMSSLPPCFPITSEFKCSLMLGGGEKAMGVFFLGRSGAAYEQPE